MKVAGLVCLIALACVAAEKATLLVHKSIDTEIDNVFAGGNLTVRHNVFNVGDASATNIVVEDVMIENAKLVDGALKASFDIIEPGQNESYVYTVTLSEAGIIDLASAQVSYETSDATEPVVSHSTELPRLPVMTAQEHKRRHSYHIEEWSVFTLIAALPTLLAYFSLLSTQTSNVRGIDAKLYSKTQKKQQ
mmetsp:Transcript_7373/g.19125  ORF Transcript_7373/g.19125 Transcript_7373/m.19125 type:complete len:192 (-) Transcript_7373:728-1303(-)